MRGAWSVVYCASGLVKGRVKDGKYIGKMAREAKDVCISVEEWMEDDEGSLDCASSALVFARFDLQGYASCLGEGLVDASVLHGGAF